MNKNEYCEDDRLDLSEYDNWTKEEINAEIARLEAETAAEKKRILEDKNIRR